MTSKFVQVGGGVEKLWIRKRDITSVGIGSIVAVAIWVVLLGSTFH